MAAWLSRGRRRNMIIMAKSQAKTENKTEENIKETIPDIGSNNIPSNIYQPLKSISEKFRIFEASYEKVFGKGIQNIPSPTSKDVEQDIENNLEDKTVQEIKEKEKTTFEPVSTLKDQSEEKKDLFKAIFLSSSEDSDSETEDNVDSEAVKSILIGKDPKEINVQRNTSPPRGIFAKRRRRPFARQQASSARVSSATAICETPGECTCKRRHRRLKFLCVPSASFRVYKRQEGMRREGI